jgi:formate--tetrahydrofolate ligase
VHECHLRDIAISAGAGFVVPIPLVRDRSCSEIMRMPGLPEVPAAEGMDIDATARSAG